MVKPFTARERFEPPVGFEPTAIFETAPFGHSGTSPTEEYYNISKPCVRNPKSYIGAFTVRISEAVLKITP